MNTEPQSACVNVMYDGSCPICTREIQVYQNLPSRQHIAWVDVSSPELVLPPGLTRQQLMARFHVQTAQGEFVDGARAFVYLWQQLPGWRYVAMLAKIPGMLPLMELTYKGFLTIRPQIHKWIKR